MTRLLATQIVASCTHRLDHIAVADSGTVQRNAPSWGLMERIGMRRRQDLDFVDETYQLDDGIIIVYSLDHATWVSTGG